MPIQNHRAKEAPLRFLVEALAGMDSNYRAQKMQAVQRQEEMEWQDRKAELERAAREKVWKKHFDMEQQALLDSELRKRGYQLEDREYKASQPVQPKFSLKENDKGEYVLIPTSPGLKPSATGVKAPKKPDTTPKYSLRADEDGNYVLIPTTPGVKPHQTGVKAPEKETKAMQINMPDAGKGFSTYADAKYELENDSIDFNTFNRVAVDTNGARLYPMVTKKLFGGIDIQKLPISRFPAPWKKWARKASKTIDGTEPEEQIEALVDELIQREGLDEPFREFIMAFIRAEQYKKQRDKERKRGK